MMRSGADQDRETRKYFMVLLYSQFSGENTACRATCGLVKRWEVGVGDGLCPRGFIVVSAERNEQDRVSSLVWIISVGSRAQRICLVVWPFDH